MSPMLQIAVTAGKAIDVVGKAMSWPKVFEIKKMNALAKLAETIVTPIFQNGEA